MSKQYQNQKKKWKKQGILEERERIFGLIEKYDMALTICNCEVCEAFREELNKNTQKGCDMEKE